MSSYEEVKVPFKIGVFLLLVLIVTISFWWGVYMERNLEKNMPEYIMTNLPETITFDSDIFYYYKAHVHEIYDGDTATSVDIDLGFGVILQDQHVRFYGIDTPELRGEEKEEGKKVAAYVKERLEGKDVILKTYKDAKGKYGRWLGEFFIDGINVNWELLDKGMAEPYGK